MSPLAARSTSIALFGGVSTLVMYTIGLHPWAGVIAWASFIYAGEDGWALRQTIASTTLGAALGWLAIMLAVSIPLPHDPNDWLWIPRQAVKVTLTLFLAVQATRWSLFAHLPITLLGFAVLFAADATIKLDLEVTHLLTAPKLYNPFLNGVLSMTAGVLFGMASKRVGDAMTSAAAA